MSPFGRPWTRRTCVISGLVVVAWEQLIHCHDCAHSSTLVVFPEFEEHRYRCLEHFELQTPENLEIASNPIMVDISSLVEFLAQRNAQSEILGRETATSVTAWFITSPLGAPPWGYLGALDGPDRNDSKSGTMVHARAVFGGGGVKRVVPHVARLAVAQQQHGCCGGYLCPLPPRRNSRQSSFGPFAAPACATWLGQAWQYHQCQAPTVRLRSQGIP